MHQPHSLWYPVLGTVPQRVGAQKMLTELVSPSTSLVAGEGRGERTKASSDETQRPLVVGVGVKMQVRVQISLILATVALGGNADLSRFVMQ